MSKPKIVSTWGRLEIIVLICVVGFFVLISVGPWRNGSSHRTSPANACINNLREIDAAKQQWALEHNAKSNDVVTISDIKPYIEHERYNPFVKFDANGNLPKCPSGGIYMIGKMNEVPTCSLGTNVNPVHVLSN